MRKALVVDDSRAIRGILKRILVGSGFEVSEAEDGLAAMQILKGGPVEFSLLCTDYNMPRMNGVDLLRRVRRLPECQALPTIMITTETHAQSIENAINAGANEYVMKPFTPEMIQDKLRILGLIEAESL